MKIAVNKESLQFVGGALVVGAAALIMFPDILKVAAGLVRILLIPIIAGGACLFLAVSTRRIMKLRSGNPVSPQVSQTVPSIENAGNDSSQTDSQTHAGS